jgi:hypothetical protein
MEAGQRHSTDGPAASPDPTAPSPATGSAMSNIMSATANETSDRTLIADDLIATF